MSLINCKNNRNNCGVPFPSTCVSYQGSFNDILIESDFPCNVNLDDIIEKLSNLIKDQKTKLQELEGEVVTNTEDVVNLIDGLNTVKNQIENINVANVYVTMDLGCLASDAAPCQVGDKKYSLFSILQLFKNEICSLKS